jgi:hypothetical protein
MLSTPSSAKAVPSTVSVVKFSLAYLTTAIHSYLFDLSIFDTGFSTLMDLDGLMLLLIVYCRRSSMLFTAGFRSSSRLPSSRHSYFDIDRSSIWSRHTFLSNPFDSLLKTV